MAEVVLLHHVRGLTDGVRAFADALRAGGHTVDTPDLFDGELPESIDAGLALVRAIGDDVLKERVASALSGRADGVVVAGFSLGAGLAQEVAQTRAGIRGALLYEGCLPVSGEWAIGPWPDGVAVQVHGAAGDPLFFEEEDVVSARELVETVGEPRAGLFVYDGDQHLFTDSSLPSFDAGATALVVERSLTFLDRLR
jgi:dienelactone hydrolase